MEKIEIELLLEGVFQHYGYDFRNYAYSTIRRRVWHCVKSEGLETISALQEKVLHDAQYMDRLFYNFTIQVTEMFRDPGFFRVFKNKVIPILSNYPFIRIWHVGCSTGEEVYSMAILLHEAGLYNKSILYATDINEKSLETAKEAVFPIEKMKSYTSNYQKAGGSRAFSEYYTATGNKANLHSFLKKNIVFAHHNLVTDGSFNEFNVVICRNVMIYFNKNLQSRVHRLFYESLSSEGFLGLGQKEGLQFTICEDCYHEIDEKEKIYQRSFR